MNQQKIRELCAKARGWPATAIIENKTFGCPPGELPADDNAWMEVPNYIDDANQADDLLEYVADGRDWLVWRSKLGYGADIYLVTRATGCKTKNLARIICALRVSDKVTDAEINDAVEGE